MASLSAASVEAPKVQTAYWDEFTSEQQEAAKILGWTEETWGTKNCPKTEYMSWEALKEEERQAAVVMGWTKETWSSAQVKPVYINPAWDLLSDDKKRAATILGWTNRTWGTKQYPESDGKNWSDLTESEKNAAQTLGFDAATWNEEDTSDSSSEEEDDSLESHLEQLSSEGFDGYQWTRMESRGLDYHANHSTPSKNLVLDSDGVFLMMEEMLKPATASEAQSDFLYRATDSVGLEPRPFCLKVPDEYFAVGESGSSSLNISYFSKVIMGSKYEGEPRDTELYGDEQFSYSTSLSAAFGESLDPEACMWSAWFENCENCAKLNQLLGLFRDRGDVSSGGHGYFHYARIFSMCTFEVGFGMVTKDGHAMGFKVFPVRWS